MTVQDSQSLSRAEAHQILKQFDCLKSNFTSAPEMADRIRQALLTVADQSDDQILGVCADSLAEAEVALKQYAGALGYVVESELSAIVGPAYLKFNPISGLCYANTYPGEHRGVLVACQSACVDGLNEVYGHLPLNLFAEK